MFCCSIAPLLQYKTMQDINLVIYKHVELCKNCNKGIKWMEYKSLGIMLTISNILVVHGLAKKNHFNNILKLCP